VPAEVRLPQAGMGMTDGTVLEWLKQVGEKVSKGECIAEVEAAKTTLEIEAPCDGVLARIVTPAGTLVPVREVMAVIALPGEGGVHAESGAHREGGVHGEGGPVSEGGVAGEGGVADPAQAPEARAAGAAPGDPAAGAAPGDPAAGSVPAAPAASAVQVVPAARRLAGEHGIDLAGLTGSGPGGRITEADVRAHLEARAGAVPLTGTRGLIARRMVASLQGSAQFTLVRGADVTDLVHRHDRGDLPGGATYTDVLARAAVLSLAEHPALNAHIAGDEIRIARRVHLGIGIDTGVALVVGVLRDADADGLAELSARRLALTERVRAGHADPAELQGSTFTITNLGHAGIDAFTPIINPPEVAILGAGRIADEPVPAPGGPGGAGGAGGPAPGGPGVAWRKSITLSLTVDHRAVDGAPAARFLATLAGYLSKPTALS
jgi:pyruvate dehydrogenase E2 component (dihydrolipoamide acetyltransferase)